MHFSRGAVAHADLLEVALLEVLQHKVRVHQVVDAHPGLHFVVVGDAPLVAPSAEVGPKLRGHRLYAQPRVLGLVAQFEALVLEGK